MATYPLIFLRQLKEMVGIESDYTAQDIRLKLAIDTATSTIESLLGKSLSKNTHEEYLASKRNTLVGYDIYGVSNSGNFAIYKQIPLYLKNFPVSTDEPFEVYYDPNGQFSEGTKLTESEYILEPETGTLYIKRAVHDYKRSLKVVYTAGYAPSVDVEGGIVENVNETPPQEYSLGNSLPADLQQAALWQAQMVYEKQYAGNINMRESRGEGSTNTARYVNVHGISPETMAICVRNKRQRIAVI